MNICAGRSAQAADTALNSVFQALLAKISADHRAALRDAERAWIGWRDRQCAFDTLGTTGGSIHPMMEAQCRTALTQAQTAHLRGQLDCAEGDVGCGGQ